MMLVTLQQASDHVRRDSSDDDADLTLKVQAASSAVVTYLKSTAYLYEPMLDTSGNPILDTDGYPSPTVDTSGNSVVRSDIQAATLLLIGEFYRNRDGDQQGAIDPQFGYGYLPRPVVALLYPYRDPTCQ